MTSATRLISAVSPATRPSDDARGAIRAGARTFSEFAMKGTTARG
jgi:hypothetical protein